MSHEFTVYQATNPATPPESLGRMAVDRPDLRQFVAANPATPASVAEWLGTLGDHAVDAALARRRPAAPQQSSAHPPPSGLPSVAPTPAPGAERPAAGQPWVPTSAPGQPWAPTASQARPSTQPGQLSEPAADGQAGGTNPYATPAGGSTSAGYGSPAGASRSGPAGYGGSAGYGGAAGYGGPGGAGYGGPTGGGGWGGPAPVSGSPLDAYGYQLPEPRGRRTGLIIAVVVAAVLLVGALGYAASSLLGSFSDDSTYGEDPHLDRLWDSCAAGDGQACDDLYMESPLGSGYEEFGDTCGNRFPANRVWCAEVM